MSTKLYVGNLSYDTTEDELREAFSQDGRSVSEVSIVMDRETGRPRGFAFVTMGSPSDAEAAIASLDGQTLGGRTLRVNPAQDRGGGGGGRGGRGGGGFDKGSGGRERGRRF